MKNTLKTIWIAALSTLVKLMAQNLTKSGFGELPKLGTIPLEYLLINIAIFSALTVLFIFVEKYLPFNKLLKGLFYSALVSIVWVALIFQPEMFENFRSYVVGVGVFFMPMMVYGMFLGYLSTEKQNKFIFSKNLIKYFIIALFWLSFHAIFMIFIPPIKAQIFNYIIWLVSASIIISIVIGFFYEIHVNSGYNTLIRMGLIIVIIFATFYLDRFASNKSFRWDFFIRLLLDVVSIILSIQVLELYESRLKLDMIRKIGENKKSLHK